MRILQVDIEIRDAYFGCLGVDGGFDSHVISTMMIGCYWRRGWADEARVIYIPAMRHLAFEEHMVHQTFCQCLIRLSRDSEATGFVGQSWRGCKDIS